MTLSEARASIGAEVIYRPCDACDFGRERGVITSVSASQVFVRYGQSRHSKATRPDNLTLVRKARPEEAATP